MLLGGLLVLILLDAAAFIVDVAVLRDVSLSVANGCSLAPLLYALSQLWRRWQSGSDLSWSRKFYVVVAASAAVGLVLVPLLGVLVALLVPVARPIPVLLGVVAGASLFLYLALRARRADLASGHR